MIIVIGNEVLKGRGVVFQLTGAQTSCISVPAAAVNIDLDIIRVIL
jgi:hypothetical protein